MLKFVQHPKCSDIKILASEIDYKNKHKHIILISKYNGILSNTTKIILKKVESRSYLRAIYLLSFIPNQKERYFMLQVFNAVATYVQNNQDVNIIKLWLNRISIKKDLKKNLVIESFEKNLKLQNSSYIQIEIGFVPKILTKKL